MAPDERGRLLAIGRELGRQVKGLVSVVQFRTYQRWVKEHDAGYDSASAPPDGVAET